MSLNIIVAILFYVVPLLLLIWVCGCCALVRENRRTRISMMHQHDISVRNPTEHSTSENDFCSPPPYTAQYLPDFEESLPSYERAINRPS